MFETGQKIVCINADFQPWVYDLYKQLPKKGSTYTVRDVRLGRSNPQFVVNQDADIKLAAADFDLLVLLEELHNPDDPYSTVKQELGFKGFRFAPAEEYEAEQEEAVGVEDCVPA